MNHKRPRIWTYLDEGFSKMCWAGLISKKQAIDPKTQKREASQKTGAGGTRPKAGNQLSTGSVRANRRRPLLLAKRAIGRGVGDDRGARVSTAAADGASWSAPSTDDMRYAICDMKRKAKRHLQLGPCGVWRRVQGGQGGGQHVAGEGALHARPFRRVDARGRLLLLQAARQE